MDSYEVYFKARKKIRHAAKYYNKNGACRTVLFCLLRMGKLSVRVFFKKERFIFFELNLTDAVFADKTDKTLDLLCTSRDDINKKYFDGWYDRHLARKRLEQDNVLLTVKEDGELIFFQWLTFKKVHIPAINLFFDIPDTTAYMAYIYTVPEHRGKRVASRAKPLALKYLKDIGYQKVFILIEPENEPSIRVNRKAGFREYQTLFYLKFFMFINFYYLRDCSSNRKKTFWSVGKTDQETWKIFSKVTPASQPAQKNTYRNY